MVRLSRGVRLAIAVCALCVVFTVADDDDGDDDITPPPVDRIHKQLGENVTLGPYVDSWSGGCWLIWAARKPSGKPMTLDTVVKGIETEDDRDHFSALLAWYNSTYFVKTEQRRWAAVATGPKGSLTLDNVSPDDSGYYASVLRCRNGSRTIVSVERLAVSEMTESWDEMAVLKEESMADGAYLDDSIDTYAHNGRPYPPHNVSVMSGASVTFKRRGFPQVLYSHSERNVSERLCWTVMAPSGGDIETELIMPSNSLPDPVFAGIESADGIIACMAPNGAAYTRSPIFNNTLSLNMTSGALTITAAKVTMTGMYRHYYAEWVQLPGTESNVAITECINAMRLYVHPGHPISFPTDNKRWKNPLKGKI